MSLSVGIILPNWMENKIPWFQSTKQHTTSQGKGWFFNVSCPPQRRCHPNPPTSGAWPSPQSWPWNRGTVAVRGGHRGRPQGEPRPKHVDVANVAATIHHSVHVQVLHQPGAANVVWCVTSSHEGKINGYWSKSWHLVNPKIAGKWMFIPLELIIIGFDPPPSTKSG